MDIIITILLAILVFLITIAVIIRIDKNRLNKKIDKRKIDSQSIRQKKNVKDPRDSIKNLNHLAKKFFKEYLKIQSELTYAEIAELLKTKNRPEMIGFCKKMDYYIYSGKKITKEESLKLIAQFIDITKTAQNT